MKPLRKLPSLEEMHQDWETNCVPADFPEVQHIEMKKAFMAGVFSMFCAMKYDVPDVSEEKGIAYLEALEKQIIKFFQEDIFKL